MPATPRHPKTHQPIATVPVPAPTRVALPKLPRGWWMTHYAVLADSRLALLGVDIDLQQIWRRDDGPPYEAAARAMARLWVFDGRRLEDGPTFPLLTPFPLFDRFPDGRWLVAGARMRNATDEGRILTPEGQEVRRICLGDGIEHLKIDRRGHIWVGWFDEGVFGNSSWRHPGHRTPPSADGLAAFDEAGNAVERAPGSAGIADCYALNLTGETAWACTYTGFPILTCQVGKPPHQWATDLAGPRALAVVASHILAVGGYGEDGSRAVLLRLSGKQATRIAEWRLPFAGDPASRVDFLDGRGYEIHVVRDGDWYRWAVWDFVSASA